MLIPFGLKSTLLPATETGVRSWKVFDSALVEVAPQVEIPELLVTEQALSVFKVPESEKVGVEPEMAFP